MGRRNASRAKTVCSEELRSIVENSISFAEVLRSLGYRTSSGTVWKLVKRRILDEGIDVSHFRSDAGPNIQKIPTADILVKNSNFKRWHLKRRIIEEGLLEYQCSICKNAGEWLGKKLSLQLDHINGVPDDNRLENLRFLCPNCHSQTSNYSGKCNKKISSLER